MTVIFDLCAIVILIVILVTLVFRKVLKTGVDRYLVSIVVIVLATTVVDFVGELFSKGFFPAETGAEVGMLYRILLLFLLTEPSRTNLSSVYHQSLRNVAHVAVE